ncbi:tryptophan synthase subunit alpha [Halalkalibacillus halophilus]|uniref:tryptophan synthase subunit alpha n=1 Tax=Halalkalibacillus halophilus TaxID=392827 RepID=UPI000415550E|nr:tryptophan synthase subunit alpha [Halalkalibacillus halophilus]
MPTVHTHGKEYLDTIFHNHLKQNKKLFVPYIMAGDGGMDQFIENLQFLDQAGASAIEVGIPFSDPVADGPTIQEAGKRALEDNVTLPAILAIIKEHRSTIQAPIIFMSYLNPILQYGLDIFMKDAKDAGIDGFIIPDLPFEQQSLIQPHLDENELALIQIVSLTSSTQRLQTIAEASQGFLYAVTVNGITGSRDTFESTLEQHFAQLKKYSNVPVLAGFGISTPEHVKQLSQYADGTVVGSKIIELLQTKDFQSIKELIQAKGEV